MNSPDLFWRRVKRIWFHLWPAFLGVELWEDAFLVNAGTFWRHLAALALLFAGASCWNIFKKRLDAI